MLCKHLHPGSGKVYVILRSHGNLPDQTASLSQSHRNIGHQKAMVTDPSSVTDPIQQLFPVKLQIVPCLISKLRPQSNAITIYRKRGDIKGLIFVAKKARSLKIPWIPLLFV